MPRFVILRHETPPGFARPAHWDFMLEEGDHLRCWALLSPPDSATAQTAEALGEHRLAFLEYEGPLSGERGHVSRWDEGTYEAVRDDDEQIELSLSGRRLQGRVALVRLAGAGRVYWRFSFSVG